RLEAERRVGDAQRVLRLARADRHGGRHARPELHVGVLDLDHGRVRDDARLAVGAVADLAHDALELLARERVDRDLRRDALPEAPFATSSSDWVPMPSGTSFTTRSKRWRVATRFACALSTDAAAAASCARVESICAPKRVGSISASTSPAFTLLLKSTKTFV